MLSPATEEITPAMSTSSAPGTDGKGMTELQALAAAQKLYKDRARVWCTRMRSPAGVMIMYEVGDAGDSASCTVTGRGATWSDALEEATSTYARRRPAEPSPATRVKALDIGRPYVRARR